MQADLPGAPPEGASQFLASRSALGWAVRSARGRAGPELAPNLPPAERPPASDSICKKVSCVPAGGGIALLTPSSLCHGPRSPMPLSPPVSRNPDRTRRRILQAAIRLFSRHGFHAVSTPLYPPRYCFASRRSRYNTIVAIITVYDFDRYSDCKYYLDVARTSD